MNEKMEANGEIPASSQGAGLEKSETPTGQWPTRAQRHGLIQSYQAQALERSDPHVANLALIDGDLMLLAQRMRESMEKDLLEGTSSGGSRRLESQLERYLKCVRQIERNAHIICQLSGPSKE